MPNYSPDNIVMLKPNEIFVYGSNEAYRHGSGAAKKALDFGAKYGVGPVCGQTYGISTKDKNIKTLSLYAIDKHVAEFMFYASQHPELTFLVSAVGCGLAGYTPAQIMPLFQKHTIFDNVHLPKSFYNLS